MTYHITFHATIGAGSEIVKVEMSYERDHDGTYAENIESITYNGMDVMGLLSEEQFADLEIQGNDAIDKEIKFALENYEP